MTVSRTYGPHRRGDVDRDLAELFDRVEKLERVRAAITQDVIGGAVQVGGAPQTIASSSQFGAVTAVTFLTEEWDTGGFVDLGANNDRITIPEDGYYLVTAGLFWEIAAVDDKIRYSALFESTGGTRLRSGLAATGQNIPGQGLRQNPVGWMQLLAGDFVYLGVTQESGGNRDVLSAEMSVIAIDAAPVVQLQ